MTWTTERLDLLRELATAGSNSWVAREINARTGSTFTRNAVIGKKKRNGIESAGPLGTRVGNQIERKQRRNDYHLQRRINTKRTNRKTQGMQNDLIFQGFLGIPFDELRPDDCRYPEGDGPFLFCGQPKFEDSSYCAHHFRLCHNVRFERPVKRKRGALSEIWGGV